MYNHSQILLSANFPIVDRLIHESITTLNIQYCLHQGMLSRSCCSTGDCHFSYNKYHSVVLTLGMLLEMLSIFLLFFHSVGSVSKLDSRRNLHKLLKLGKTLTILVIASSKFYY